MKKILFFFPLNPLEKNEGNKTRALQLLLYFKSRNFQVDFVTQKDFGSQWNDEEIQNFESAGLVNNLHILRKKPVKKNLIRYFLFYKIPNFILKLKLNVPQGSLPNHATSYERSRFLDILKKNNYEFIILSYAYWAYLLYNNKKFLNGATTIIDTHDFLSSQRQKDKHFKLGRAVEEEVRRLKLFDQIWTVSSDELYFFNQFLPGKAVFIPVMRNKPSLSPASLMFDMIYVASHNDYNRQSADWFFTQVFPLLSKGSRILVVGKITAFIDNHPGITKIPFADNLDECYAKAKIAVCPMLGGTGIKVKVVEALSHSKPVVCTPHGVDGLPNKYDNGCMVTSSPQKFASMILQLLNNNDLYNKLSSQADRTFDNFFRQEKVFKDLDVLFKIQA